MEDNQHHHEENTDIHQWLSQENIEDSLARHHQQRGALETNLAGPSEPRDSEEKMEVDRSHPAEATR